MVAVVKILASAVLIYVVNEIVVKHSRPWLGSLIASLPIVSLLTFLWIHVDMRTRPAAETVEKLASHSTGIFWFVLPSLPMFLVFPALLRRGLGFWPSLLAGCLLTVVLYVVASRILARFGIVI